MTLHSYAFQVIFFGEEHSKNLSAKSLYKQSQMSIVMALICTDLDISILSFYGVRTNTLL